ncbi:phosphoribosyl-ATP diphosphatase [Leptospira sp. GIMC2001]|uniref:phosphoribosyl-ATP diphosphatase n=1 Tax=Leptospira sp. GIMC2001 TaxID=1513297 RepID=UPI00234AF6A4|nr:phosphoribosyl-ATP diphosphatase [Leptospira sp. GIMC2001]WCL48578.1 phosphoribosyl-ATP diphosphatase [Leptospira sp. GIMC2001]
MEFLKTLESTLKKRKAELPDNSYTANLFRDGVDRILKKVGEESGEVLIAAKNPSQAELLHEIADLVFHLEVLLVEKGLSFSDVVAELEKRHS